MQPHTSCSKAVFCLLIFAALMVPAEAAQPVGNVPSPSMCRLLIIFTCSPLGMHQLPARALKALLAQFLILTESVSQAL